MTTRIEPSTSASTIQLSPASLPRVKALETLGLDALRQEWARHFDHPPPLRSKELLRLLLAWRLQARVHGGIDPATRRKLKRVGPIHNEGLHLGAGTKLTREWQGVIEEVVVEEQGFRWKDKSYASLSGVAFAITGTRWNGPRFFGLREDK